MSKTYPDGYDWKAAEADVEEMGGDVEMIQTSNARLRDDYLREMELDPKRYTKNVKPETPHNDYGSGEDGCYVATCVYGSYDCPEVWTLRRFRDNTLARSWYGRLFIRTYYAVSPTVVKWFGETVWFRSFWKGRLDGMVNDLRNSGVSCAPYQDRNWRRR